MDISALINSFTTFMKGPALLIITCVLFVICTVLLLPVIGKWKLFVKAGYPGWAIFIPYYKDYVLFRVAGLPWWSFVIRLLISFLIPSTIIDIIVKLIVSILVATKGFARSIKFGIGLYLLPFIFYPILGFNKDPWQHPQYHLPFFKSKKNGLLESHIQEGD